MKSKSKTRVTQVLQRILFFRNRKIWFYFNFLVQTWNQHFYIGNVHNCKGSSVELFYIYSRNNSRKEVYVLHE